MSERKYFPINEGATRTAHNMMSMRDYSEGSTTRGYQSEVNKAYDLADKVAEKRPEEAGRAYRLAERYSKKMAEYYNKESSIGMMCPSVLISGALFPMKKPDLDNVMKIMCDALNGIAYKDDAQIVNAKICKRWSSEMPSVWVTIEGKERKSDGHA